MKLQGLPQACAALVLLASAASAAPPIPDEISPPSPPKAEEPLKPADKPPLKTDALPGADAPPPYDMKLHELEENVTTLKEKIFRSKERLQVLREQILHNVIAEARAVIVHKNEMGSSFTLEQVLYYLDNEKVYFQDNKDGALDKRNEFEIFNGNAVPGNHILAVELVYRGNGTLFKYIDGYLFKIKSNYTFYAQKGRIARIKVVGYERGGMTADLEQKPYVKYEVQQFRYSKENAKRLGEGDSNLDDEEEKKEE